MAFCLRRCKVLPLCSIQEKVKTKMILTTDERYGSQLLPPFMRNLDRFLLHIFVLSSHSLVVGMLDQIPHVFRFQRIKNVEEVSAIGQTPIRAGIRQVPHNLPIILMHGIDFSYRELIIQRNIDILDFAELEQCLLFFENLL